MEFLSRFISGLSKFLRASQGGSSPNDSWLGRAQNAIHTFAEAADRAEDHAQSLVNGAAFFFGCGLLTTIVVACALFLVSNGAAFGVMVTLLSLFWILAPFAGFLIWYRNERLLVEKGAGEDTNSHSEQAGNGVVIGGALVLVMAFTAGFSTLVIAAICTAAAYAFFAWAYVWVWLISMGIAFVMWSVLDIVSNGVKMILRAVIPDALEGKNLKLESQINEKFGFVGLAYCVAMIYPIMSGVAYHTSYGANQAALGIFVALCAGFVGLAGSMHTEAPAAKQPEADAAAEVVDAAHEKKPSKKRAAPLLGMFLWGGASIIGFFVFNVFVPPPPAETGKEALSYVERLNVAPPSGGSASTCSPQMTSFIDSLKADTCKEVIKNNRDAGVVNLCKKAIACKGLQADGMKLPQKASETKSGWEVPSPKSVLCSVVGLVLAAILARLVYIGWNAPPEKKESKKSEPH